MSKLFSFLTLLLLSFLFITQVHAADSFVLTNIGALDTKGMKYSQWWYEPQNVILKGTGSKGANIDITIDGKVNTIKASAEEGKWTYDLGMLDKADHSIVIGSGGDQYSFVLTIGSSPPADMNNTKGGLPTAGQLAPFLGILALAGFLIFYSFKREKV
jgi:hypothetical protein